VYYHDGKDDVDVVLKGCIRVEKIDEPTFYIHVILQKAQPEHIKKTYGIDNWEDDHDFLEKLAVKKGKLKKVKRERLTFRIYFLEIKSVSVL